MNVFPVLLPLFATPKISWVTTNVQRAGWYKMNALYPQFRGNAVARLASQDVREVANGRLMSLQKNASLSSAPPRRPWSVRWKGRVSAVTNRFVSVLGTCDYDTGGARPSQDAIGLNYAIRGGVAKRIALADLMVIRSEPAAFASSVVLPKLREMGVQGVESGAVFRLTKAQADNFVMTPAGLSWVFSPGEVGSREDGMVVAKFTWDELKGRVSKEP